jgi:hypothetical protein
MCCETCPYKYFCVNVKPPCYVPKFYIIPIWQPWFIRYIPPPQYTPVDPIYPQILTTIYQTI